MAIIQNGLFIGKPVLGSVVDAPLSADANGALVSGIIHSEISSTSSTTTNSGTDALMNSMTTTPASGTYLVIFSTDLNSPSGGAIVTLSFYVGGTQNANSQRKVMPFAGGTLTAGNQRVGISLNQILTVNGSQAIEVRWSTSAGTITAANRTMNLVRVA